MKILAIEREAPGANAAEFLPLLEAEARQVWGLYRQGVIRELYFRPDEHAAVLILECAETTAARDALAALPLVQAGLIAFEVIPLAPYTGFERLFQPSNGEAERKR